MRHEPEFSWHRRRNRAEPGACTPQVFININCYHVASNCALPIKKSFLRLCLTNKFNLLQSNCMLCILILHIRYSYLTVQPILPVLQPCKPLTTCFMPVCSNVCIYILIITSHITLLLNSQWHYFGKCRSLSPDQYKIYPNEWWHSMTCQYHPHHTRP